MGGRLTRYTGILIGSIFLAIVCAWPSSIDGQIAGPANPDVPGNAWHPVVIPSPSPQESHRAVPPKPLVRPDLRGVASWYSSWCDCTAMRQWRGRLVRVVGPGGSQQVRINDYGPARWTGRIIDLNPATFRAVCGPLSRGTCVVSVDVLQ